MSTPILFTPLTLRGVTFPNRIFVSPMCQYSAVDGVANDWHLVHLGSRAAGGVGAVILEATAVTPEGRISPEDLGIWNDGQIAPLARIAAFIRSQGAVPGIQLAHAGRKASTDAPWRGGHHLSVADGGWETVAPSPVAYNPADPAPREMTGDDIAAMIDAFGAAAARAVKAGFGLIEIHGAHGYLLHQFLSPLSNRRTDKYADGRLVLLGVIEAVRAVWAGPLLLRVSATDWVEGGWSVEDTVAVSRLAAEHGVDLVDCSSGGLSREQKIPVGPGYQVPFAERVRREAGVPTGAVGMITGAAQAEAILEAGQADVVLLARELLRRPYWAIEAARELGAEPRIPQQYLRAF